MADHENNENKDNLQVIPFMKTDKETLRTMYTSSLSVCSAFLLEYLPVPITLFFLTLTPDKDVDIIITGYGWA